MLVLQVIFIQMILPIAFLYDLWRGKYENRLDWMIKVAFSALFVAWLFQTGRWDWLGIYISYVWPLLFFVAGFVSWKKTSDLPFLTPLKTSDKISKGIYVVLLVVFGWYNLSALSGYSTENETLDLTFPLQDGSYYVAHGGSSTQLNYHHAYEPQQYALDIMKVNSYGARANGLLPENLDDYLIYDDQLYSPCDGEVVETKDGIADMPPSKANPQQPEGNYVTVQCEETEAVVYIAHMREGSTLVDEGEMIEEGDPIGAVGNSGNTSEPHLHIHAERDGVGVPLTFDGRFLTRNDIVRVPVH
ncbi:M23 family metallopeptidase [Texcoconibacillus texcoconensis]|uniref:M23ase beta-sheet core domain-containing protein n=1 Tax=Texcoconibacillus texcoconensis TaxID=1095777 RepID=A0A840QP54_9BACI|nr:M23 family metallopeptidase [Texcoconibacillus texcoconensis]MBB5173155.1 hypothetical protein [Texcoconibacillus texcoconensis]